MRWFRLEVAVELRRDRGLDGSAGEGSLTMEPAEKAGDDSQHVNNADDFRRTVWLEVLANGSSFC